MSNRYSAQQALGPSSNLFLDCDLLLSDQLTHDLPLFLFQTTVALPYLARVPSTDELPPLNLDAATLTDTLPTHEPDSREHAPPRALPQPLDAVIGQLRELVLVFLVFFLALVPPHLYQSSHRLLAAFELGL